MRVTLRIAFANRRKSHSYFTQPHVTLFCGKRSTTFGFQHIVAFCFVFSVMQHRIEIDGLRAVAVVSVVLFHARSSLVPGGFAGVDVFLVISGYLITSVIHDDLSRGTFTFAAFYERRARRILPALFVMLFATTLIAWFVLLPPAFRHFGISAAATALSASNIYFLRNVDYFAGPAEFVPLIHTWSLGIEEQFYLLFPAFLVFLRARGGVLITLLLLAVASLAVAQWSAVSYPAASFYLLHTRCWELLVGAIIAHESAKLAAFRRLPREVLSLVGLLALLSTYILYDRQTPFPGLYAMAPVVGAALIIAFGTSETIVGRALSCRPLPFIGLISYSTYLWHQPLFALARHASLNAPSAPLLATLSIAAFAIGAASWKWIEQPFRDRTWLTRKSVFSLAGACSVVVIGFGIASWHTQGFRSRFDAALLALLETKGSWATDPCHRSDTRTIDLSTSCVLGDASNVVGALIGDSHAGTIAQTLGEALAAQGIGLLQMTLNGCPPIPEVYRTDMGLAHDCASFHAQVRERLARDATLSHVVVVSRWTRFLKPAGFDNTEGGVEITQDRIAHLEEGRPRQVNDNARVDLIKQKTTHAIQGLLALGKHVVLVYPIPEVGWDVPMYLARRELLRQKLGEATSPGSTRFDAYQNRNEEAFQMLDGIGQHHRLARVYPHAALCNTLVDGRCVFLRGSEALYTDHNHVSLAGARLFVPDVVSKINRTMYPGP